MSPKHEHHHEPEVTFAELDCDELAEHAFNVFMYQGRHPLGARLIYQALKQEDTHPLALRCLADILNQEGLEVFSALTLEYALIHAEVLSEAEIKALHQVLFASKWAWGFAKHSSGKTELTPEDFERHGEFTVDHERYQNFIAPIIKRAGSVEAAFRSAHTVCGIMAQFLLHLEAPKTTQFDEVFYPERFNENSNYNQWLESYERALDELAAKRFVDQLCVVKNKEHS